MDPLILPPRPDFLIFALIAVSLESCCDVSTSDSYQRLKFTQSPQQPILVDRTCILRKMSSPRRTLSQRQSSNSAALCCFDLIKLYVEPYAADMWHPQEWVLHDWMMNNFIRVVEIFKCTRTSLSVNVFMHAAGIISLVNCCRYWEIAQESSLLSVFKAHVLHNSSAVCVCVVCVCVWVSSGKSLLRGMKLFNGSKQMRQHSAVGRYCTSGWQLQDVYLLRQTQITY